MLFKKYLVKVLLFFAVSASASVMAQTKENLALTIYLKPKMGSQKAFLEKIIAFGKANWTGNLKYRLQRVYGGTNDGDYIVSKVQRTNWAYYDNDNNTDAKMLNAMMDEVGSLLESRTTIFQVFREDLSTPNMPPLTKASSSIYFVKPGKSEAFEAYLSKALAVWKAIKWNVAVIKAVSGNSNRYVVQVRHVNGWKERDQWDDFKNAYIKMYGRAEWTARLDMMSQCVESINIQLQAVLPEFRD